MYYHIISSDLDGTLLSPEYHLTEYTKNVIQTLVKKGIYFVIATGRHYSEAYKIRESLGVSACLITSNGARIYDFNDKLVYSCDLDKKIVLKLIQILSLDKDVLVQLYSHNNWYINSNYNNSSKFFLSLDFKYKLFNYKYLQHQNISKIFFTSNNFKKLFLLENYINCQFKNLVNVNFSCSSCLEVTGYKASKGHGLKLVSSLLGFSLENCLSFGDGMNDKDMLEISGKGCIVKNGCSILKRCLPHIEIIGSNAEDGVACYLHKLFLN
ncbi:MAG: Cof-type HAD-IIB family hydrolase [Buchnera aphidicola (Meitanaphis microgallis)]